MNFSMAVSQKIRKQPYPIPSNIPFGIHSKGPQLYPKDMCSTILIAALFVTARTQKQCKCPSTEEWLRKMWYIYTMEYYTGEKNNDILKIGGKWMDLENTILSEIT